MSRGIAAHILGLLGFNEYGFIYYLEINNYATRHEIQNGAGTAHTDVWLIINACSTPAHLKMRRPNKGKMLFNQVPLDGTWYSPRLCVQSSLPTMRGIREALCLLERLK